MELSLQERLLNWGAKMRERYQQHEADSFEGGYRSPQPWNEVPIPPTPRTAAQVTELRGDAAIIDRTIAGLPVAYSSILRAEYVGRLPPGGMMRIARELGSFRDPNMDDVRAMLSLARAMLNKRLALPTVFRQPPERVARAQQVLSASDRETDKY